MILQCLYFSLGPPTAIFFLKAFQSIWSYRSLAKCCVRVATKISAIICPFWPSGRFSSCGMAFAFIGWASKWVMPFECRALSLGFSSPALWKAEDARQPFLLVLLKCTSLDNQTLPKRILLSLTNTFPQGFMSLPSSNFNFMAFKERKNVCHLNFNRYSSFRNYFTQSNVHIRSKRTSSNCFSYLSSVSSI